MKVINALYEIAQDNKNITIKTNAFFRKLTTNISYNELIKGLNSEVKIIEENNKIEKLEQKYLNANYVELVDKINEIIDKVNKL